MSAKIFKRDLNSSSVESDEGESQSSEARRFEENHQIESIFEPAQGADKISVTVMDTGIGIKKNDRIKLFKLFGTLLNTRQMNTQGIGLGLVISENIVKSFGGTIGVRSKYKKGSKFAFSIVLGKDDNFEDIMNQNVVLNPNSNRSIKTSGSHPGTGSKSQQ